MLLRPQPNRANRALLGLRFLVIAIALLKLQQLTRQNATQLRTVACLRAQLADLGPARDVNACGVPDDVAPSKEACAGTDDAAIATEDDEAFTAPRLATLAATLICVAAAAVEHAYVHETARKPLADVQAMLKRGLPPTVEYRPMDDDERHVELAEL